METAGRTPSLDHLHALVKTWQRNQDGIHDCPACDMPGILIIDASARPHTEWYIVTCINCGLSEALAVPLAAPPGR